MVTIKGNYDWLQRMEMMEVKAVTIFLCTTKNKLHLEQSWPDGKEKVLV